MCRIERNLKAGFRAILIIQSLLLACNAQSAEVPAFPGAQGFGAVATGGRGGRVLKVTNLNASGPGSLQAALNIDARRIIVFTVSGVIEADEILIPHGNVTVAGQTAPGGGITIAGRLTAKYNAGVNNIVLRHLRIRPPKFRSQVPGNQFDALQISTSNRVMLDHLSVAFGVDETIDLYSAKNVTLQWSTVEMSATEGHPERQHNYGLINGPDGGHITLHHNIFAHHNKRAPALSAGPSETINNVIYNVRDAWVHHNPASGPFVVVGNFFKDGPSADLLPFFLDAESVGGNLAYYFDSNYMDNPGNYVGEVEPWTVPEGSTNMQYTCAYFNGPPCANFRVTARPDFSTVAGHVDVATESYTDGFSSVMTRAGGFPRDVVTRTAIDQIENRTGTWGAHIPDELMAGLTVAQAPQDNDDDGMADDWELTRGLSPTDPDDHSSVLASGYTAIEEYINDLADRLVDPTTCAECRRPNPPRNLSARPDGS